jgi:hypothetical protein
MTVSRASTVASFVASHEGCSRESLNGMGCVSHLHPFVWLRLGSNHKMASPASSAS